MNATPIPLLSSLRAAGMLACAGLLAALLLSLVHAWTRGPIDEAERRAALALLNTVLPPDLHDNDLLGDFVEIYEPERLGHRQPVLLYRGWLEGRPAAIAVEVVARDGYSGDIRLLVGITREHRISGVRVISHKETPGLGDGIEAERSDWILSFTGRALGDPPAERWTVRRDGGDFDQFTGATITPRAVTRAVARALAWHQQASAGLWAMRSESSDEDPR